jgi:hypothetical protein
LLGPVPFGTFRRITAVTVAVDRKLGECEFGPGIVARVCAEVQRAFVVAPADFEQPTSRRRRPEREQENEDAWLSLKDLRYCAHASPLISQGGRAEPATLGGDRGIRNV